MLFNCTKVHQCAYFFFIIDSLFQAMIFFIMFMFLFCFVAVGVCFLFLFVCLFVVLKFTLANVWMSMVGD